jgi:hypothetical protein
LKIGRKVKEKIAVLVVEKSLGIEEKRKRVRAKVG